MIKKLLICLCVALFGLFFSETNLHAITSYWKFSRELLSPSSQLGEKYGRLTLPMEVLGRSQPSLADLRILDATGNEVPYVRLRSVLQTEKPLNTRLFNIGILPDGTRLVTVDTGTDRMMHSRVNIELQGIDFVATVKVEGSDDQKSWAQLTTGVILDRPYRHTKVNYSQVNYRYLRLTISHKSGNTGEVDDVEVFPAEINTAPQSAFSKEAITFTAKPTLSKNNDAMIWEMQTPYPINVAALTFDISSDYFERRVEIKVSDDGKQWFTTGRGFIFRYPDGGKSLQVQMPVEKSRYWQVWLYHDIDKPLAVSK